MRIVYLALLPVLDEAIGVIKKINAQCECLRREKVEVDVYIFYKDDSNEIDFNEYPSYFIFKKYYYYGLFRPIQKYVLWNNISKIVKDPKYKIIYFRYPGSSFFTYKLLKRNPKKIIFEHNTNELDHIKMGSNRPVIESWNEKHFAKKSFKFALGNVGKSTDFSEHQEEKVGYSLNLITITNGVNVLDIEKERKINFKINDQIKLIFVANVAQWHGLERLLQGIKNYDDEIDYKLFLIGNEEKYLELIDQFKLNNLLGTKIIVNGFMTGTKLDEMFKTCHFAIGSLGLHRINIFRGVPLKHREYLSRGIPFIFSGDDEDINSDIERYLFNISADESPVNFSEFLRFIQILYIENDDISEKLIDYAFKKVDMSIKSRDLKKYFKSLVDYENN